MKQACELAMANMKSSQLISQRAMRHEMIILEISEFSSQL
jgi:hypothetical protein